MDEPGVCVYVDLLTEKITFMSYTPRYSWNSRKKFPVSQEFKEVVLRYSVIRIYQAPKTIGFMGEGEDEENGFDKKNEAFQGKKMRSTRRVMVETTS